MKRVVVDFETYYDKEYSLSKMTTEEYVRDERFETIMCGFKVGNASPYWIPGPMVAEHLTTLQLEECAVIAHHAQFDGLILSHRYGVRPGFWIDTLSMARALHGAKGGNSLAKLSQRYGLPPKGTEVLNAIGKHYADFSRAQLAEYGAYCCHDCSLENKLAKRMVPQFAKFELDLIDATIRLFTEPTLRLNVPKLQEYIEELRIRQVDLLMRAGVQLTDVRSNDKFAEALRFFGVTPPVKMSPKTGKLTYAFAKTDIGMQELLEHEDEAVQALAAARINARSTINETRAERMIGMASRGAACVYLNYYGADQTGRASGGDKMNWQNLTRGSLLREAVEAPKGHELVVGDSANIESRQLDWLAGQDDQVEAYRNYDRGTGPDIYCVMAEKIFKRKITKKNDPNERFLGKVSKLGLGYGMGDEKFAVTAKIAPSLASDIVRVYRESHPRVMALHKRANEALELIAQGVVGAKVDYRGIVTTAEQGLLLPNGLVIKYTDLERSKEGWTYWNGRARVKIYGGKVVENIVQALARIIVMTQTLMVPRKLVMSVHDEGVWCVPVEDVLQTEYEVSWALRQPLPWCPDLPLNCEVGSHKSYGKAKT
jgi:DNA polymerase